MSQPIIFPYKIYKHIASPIVRFQVYGAKGWLFIEAYADSGAFISVLLPKEAENLGIDFKKGRLIYIMVGDGSYIPVYLHKLPIKIGDVSFQTTIGFSEKLGVGFNLLGRKDIFERFDVLFSDSKKTISFLPK